MMIKFQYYRQASGIKEPPTKESNKKGIHSTSKKQPVVNTRWR